MPDFAFFSLPEFYDFGDFVLLILPLCCCRLKHSSAISGGGCPTVRRWIAGLAVPRFIGSAR